jgi:phosphoglycolate phosphatase
LKFRGLLFDLDGTLVDTAPDLVAALNTTLAAAGQPPMAYALARNVVSRGAVGLLRRGLSLGDDAPVPEDLRQQLLQHYRSDICTNSRLFIKLESLLNLVSNNGLVWGIVTNKPQALTQPLLEALNIDTACVVSGDTLPERKPSPAPLLHAADLLGVPATACVYVGDARGDVEAAHAAGMAALAAAYGYIRPEEDVAAWGAEAVIQHASELEQELNRLGSSGSVV